MGYARPQPGEATDRAVVTVVFLRMNHPQVRPMVKWPEGVVLRAERMNVAEYRTMYHDIGAKWLWWLRRIMPDDVLARHLASNTINLHVLRIDGEIAGFFETDAGGWPDVNLNYFGLMPDAIGKGLGKTLLDAAVDSVFRGAIGVRGMTVNTCSADHARALPNYLAAGFREMRRVKEVWDIPCRLGLNVPEHLRG